MDKGIARDCYTGAEVLNLVDIDRQVRGFIE